MTKNEIIDSLEYLLSQIEDDDAQIFYTSDEVEAVREAISIVKTLTEEHNNDFCEWKLEEDNGIVWHCSDECSTYNNSYIKNLRIVLEDFEVICPHCGKKIKVVE